MTKSEAPHRPLPDLIAELEAAVRAENLDLARQLEQVILQRLAAEANERTAVERRVRELMAELDATLAAAALEGPPFLEPPAPAAPPVPSEAPGRERPTRDVSFGGSVRGDDSPPKREVEPRQGRVYPVWFGTNRKPSASGTGFTGERHDHLTRGRVDVFVPEAHRIGETGTPFWKRLLRGELRDDHLRVQLIERLEHAAFLAAVQRVLADARKAGEPEAHALVFLHGFNVSFEEAAIRAAQIGFDLAVPGATAFFSWPSRGSVTAYPADEASIEASEGAITEFLVDFARGCGAEKVHVIAHSMGNRGLLRALQRIAANAETRGTVKLSQIFLAAPDVDRDVFCELAHLYAEHAERTTLYTSRADRAVHLSSIVHDAPRAGYFEPITVTAGVDTIAVPSFDVDLLGHSYFAQAAALLHDMHDLLRHATAPQQRQRVAAETAGGARYWRLLR